MANNQSSLVWVVIPAAGTGQRMQSELPKQYLKINGKTVLEHTLNSFFGNNQIAGIVVVLSPEDKNWNTSFSSATSIPVFTVDGGKNRSESVLHGLNYLIENNSISTDTWVMVHDAARPCLSKTDINSLLSIQHEDCIGGILASPVRDTMKRSIQQKEQSVINKTENRDDLWHALTPQLFRLGEIKEAIKYCQKRGINITDECSAMESMGHNPRIIEGSHNNIKITYPTDLDLASFLIEQNSKESKT